MEAYKSRNLNYADTAEPSLHTDMFMDSQKQLLNLIVGWLIYPY